MSGLTISDTMKVGCNRHGYEFLVGRMGERWVGLASGTCEDGSRVCFLLTEISIGVDTGVPDRDEAIRMTGAVAQDVESGYGGIETWYVPDELRGRTEDYRCGECGRIHPHGAPCEDDGWMPDDLEDAV